MSITTIPSRQFNQDITKAKKAAKSGPVIITDRGNPAYVLLTIEEYQKITGTKETILDLLAMDGVADISYEAPHLEDNFFKTADFA